MTTWRPNTEGNAQLAEFFRGESQSHSRCAVPMVLRPRSQASRVRGRAMEFQDKTLKCVDCGNDFIFTAGEQLFFHDKQFKNEPKRCKNCKAQRAASMGHKGGGGGNFQKVETRTTCSGC